MVTMDYQDWWGTQAPLASGGGRREDPPAPLVSNNNNIVHWGESILNILTELLINLTMVNSVQSQASDSYVANKAKVDCPYS